ncbi:hypothetical protein [Leptolyngbya phage Lbo-JY46]
MRDLICSAGHGGTDPGASGNGLIERDETIWLRDAICAELDTYGVKYKKDRNQDALAATLAFFSRIWKPTTIAVDIHFNSFPNSQSNGTEVFIPNNATQFEKDLAGAVLKDLVQKGNFRNRGVKTPAQSGRGVLGWFRPNAEQILIEVCFLSNKTDVALWKANKNNIAKAIAKTLSEYVKK